MGGFSWNDNTVCHPFSIIEFIIETNIFHWLLRKLARDTNTEVSVKKERSKGRRGKIDLLIVKTARDLGNFFSLLSVHITNHYKNVNCTNKYGKQHVETNYKKYTRLWISIYSTYLKVSPIVYLFMRSYSKDCS